MKGAVIKEVAALHVSIGHWGGGQPSVSTQVGALRKLLTEPQKGDLRQYVASINKVMKYISCRHDRDLTFLPRVKCLW